MYSGATAQSRHRERFPIALVDEDQSDRVTRAIIADLADESLVDDAHPRSPGRRGSRAQPARSRWPPYMPEEFRRRRRWQALFGGHGETDASSFWSTPVRPSAAGSWRVCWLSTACGKSPNRHSAAPRAKPRWRPHRGLQPALRRSDTANDHFQRDNVPYNGYAHSFAGMTTQFILLAGIDAGDGAVADARARQYGSGCALRRSAGRNFIAGQNRSPPC